MKIVLNIDGARNLIDLEVVKNHDAINFIGWEDGIISKGYEPVTPRIMLDGLNMVQVFAKYDEPTPIPTNDLKISWSLAPSTENVLLGSVEGYGYIFRIAAALNDDNRFFLYEKDNVIKSCGTIDEAKEVAQSHFDSKISKMLIFCKLHYQ